MCLIEVETLYFLTQFFFIRVIKYLRTLLILFCWVLFTILAFIFKSKIGWDFFLVLFLTLVIIKQH